MKYIIDENDLKQRFIDHDILVRYFRNKLGFKVGAVVAIGPGEVGWSMVHKNDYNIIPTTLNSAFSKIPILENLKKEIPEVNDLLKEKKNPLSAVYTYIKVPVFDRFNALKIALNRAISPSVSKTEIPYEIRDLLSTMEERSIKYWEIKAPLTLIKYEEGQNK